MAESHSAWSYEGPFATLTIDRPKALNALNTQALRRAGEGRCDCWPDDEQLRALIVTGAGRRPSSPGADIAEMAAMDAHRARASFGARWATGRWTPLEALPVPTIAAVNGFALGGRLRAGPGLRLHLRLGEGALRPARGEPGGHPRLRRHPAAGAAGRAAPGPRS